MDGVQVRTSERKRQAGRSGGWASRCVQPLGDAGRTRLDSKKSVVATGLGDLTNLSGCPTCFPNSPGVLTRPACSLSPLLYIYVLHISRTGRTSRAFPSAATGLGCPTSTGKVGQPLRGWTHPAGQDPLPDPRPAIAAATTDVSSCAKDFGHSHLIASGVHPSRLFDRFSQCA